eukprot:1153242-Pelagomonas_calceolata.AAC.1
MRTLPCRDIKPENCMIQRSNHQLKLIDFGESIVCKGNGQGMYLADFNSHSACAAMCGAIVEPCVLMCIFARCCSDLSLICSLLVEVAVRVNGTRSMEKRWRTSLTAPRVLKIQFCARSGNSSKVASGKRKKEKKNSARKKIKTTQAVKTLPTSIKEKKIPRAKAPHIPSTKRVKKSQGGTGGLLAVLMPDLQVVDESWKRSSQERAWAVQAPRVCQGLSKHLESTQGIETLASVLLRAMINKVSARLCVTLGVGTPDYLSPEMLQAYTGGSGGGASGYDARAVDAWAMGVLMYLLTTGKYPFEDPRHPNVLSQTIQNVLHGRMQPFPSSMSPGCRALIMGLLQCNPKQRTTLHIRQDKNLYDSVICHPSFRKLRCHLKARLCFLLTLTLCIKCKAWEHQSLGASECKWKLWLHLLHHSGLCPRPGKVTVAAVPSPSIWQSGTYVFADVKDVYMHYNL